MADGVDNTNPTPAELAAADAASGSLEGAAGESRKPSDRSAEENESPADARARRLAEDFDRRMQGRLATVEGAEHVFREMIRDGLLIVRDLGRDELGVWLPREAALRAMHAESTLRLSWPGGINDGVHVDPVRPIVEIELAREEDR